MFKSLTGLSQWLMFRPFLILLFFINLFGTVYGYIWYGYQLAMTEPKFLLFVPDSPTASLFFTIVLGLWIIGRHAPLIEALAFITLVKYGLWAVVMNLLTLSTEGNIGWLGWMLVVSHFAMALQAVLYIPFYRFGFLSVWLTAIWTFHNDVIDYVFGQMPIYSSLSGYSNSIGYFTFWLSVACVSVAFFVTIINQKKRSQTLSIDQS